MNLGHIPPSIKKVIRNRAAGKNTDYIIELQQRIKELKEQLKKDCRYCPHNEGGCGYYEILEGK